jgi:hypothetical protein
MLINSSVVCSDNDVSDGHRSRVVRLLPRPYLGGAFPSTRLAHYHGAQYRPLRVEEEYPRLDIGSRQGVDGQGCRIPGKLDLK